MQVKDMEQRVGVAKREHMMRMEDFGDILVVAMKIICLTVPFSPAYLVVVGCHQIMAFGF